MRLPDRPTRAARGTPALVCARRGRHWRIEWHGRTAEVDDLVGLRHLATLVANPGVDIPAVQLVGPTRRSSGPEPGRQPVLDQEALRQYRSRLRTLADDIREADLRGDGERAAELQSEADWLLHEVEAATGLGGRPRHFTDDSERARIAVGKAIRRALERVSAADAVIGEELRACIETGVHCCYRPVDSI